MKRRMWHRLLLGFLLAAAGFGGALTGLSWLLRPKPQPPVPRPVATVSAVAESREMHMDPLHPPRLQRDVDYSEGPVGAWYPKGESPLLADLVKAAIASAQQKAADAATEAMKELTGGMDLPGLSDML